MYWSPLHSLASFWVAAHDLEAETRKWGYLLLVVPTEVGVLRIKRCMRSYTRPMLLDDGLCEVCRQRIAYVHMRVRAGGSDGLFMVADCLIAYAAGRQQHAAQLGVFWVVGNTFNSQHHQQKRGTSGPRRVWLEYV